MSESSWFQIFSTSVDDDVIVKAPSSVATDTFSVNDVLRESENALSLTVTPRHSVIGTGSELTKTQLCATVTARDSPVANEEDIRASVDIVVALDVSVSMNGAKLTLCKKSLELLINSLLPGDRFGLVTFSETAEVEIPIQEVTKELKEHALGLVKSLHTKACTNISHAVWLSVKELQTVLAPNSVRTVFFLTDGLANEGVTDYYDLVKMTKECCVETKSAAAAEATLAAASAAAAAQAAAAAAANDDVSEESSWENILILPTEEQIKSPPPISIHCFGYGSNHDSRMLLGISEATSGGSYYFVENDENVITAFGDALGGVFSVVAQNVVLKITIPPESKDGGVEILKVYHKDKVEHRDMTYSVSIGDLYAEESRDILFEVSLARSNCTVDYWITHATVSISYVDLVSEKLVSCKPVPCDIARISGSAVSAADQHVKVQWLRVRVTETIRDADKLAARGNVREAQIMIGNMLEVIDMSTDDIRSDELVKQLAEDLNRCKKGLVSYAAYTHHGSHTMRNTFQSHGTQRCMDSYGTARRNVYRGSRKSKTINAFQNH